VATENQTVPNMLVVPVIAINRVAPWFLAPFMMFMQLCITAWLA
jgi:hypothetical protein